LHGVPRAITTTQAYQGLARMGEEEWMIRTNWAHQMTSTILVKSQLYLKRDWMEYKDADISLASSHFNETAGLLMKSTLILSPNIQLRTGIDAAITRIKSSDAGDHDRQQSSLHALLTWLFWQKKNTLFNFSLAGRGEYYSGIGTIFLPRAGINFIIKDWQLFISSGYNFRVPTLNELYWQPGGDPNLKPEKSMAYEAGAGYSWKGVLKGKINLSFYYTNLDEMIRWYPTNTGLWRPKNLDRVVSKGMEVLLKFDLIPELAKASIDYKYGLSKLVGTTTVDQELVGNRLAYQPSTEVKAMIDVNFNDIRIGAGVDYMSFRYTTLANLNDQILPSATVYHLFIDYTLSWQLLKVMVYGKINNLFQKEYQYINQYPLPLQPWKVGLRFELSGDKFSNLSRRQI
jgi:iron complex outermembrane receptor protein